MSGWKYRRSLVRGTIVVNNHRATPITLAIQRKFSGDMVAADGDPKVTFREEGVFSVNRRNQLNWTITLTPGEERTLNYQYKVQVRH